MTVVVLYVGPGLDGNIHHIDTPSSMQVAESIMNSEIVLSKMGPRKIIYMLPWLAKFKSFPPGLIQMLLLLDLLLFLLLLLPYVFTT